MNDTDFDEDVCLCQGKVPADKRIDFIQFVTEEDHKTKKPKSRWKPVLRFHKDCPFHGIKVTVTDATRTEPKPV